VQTALQQTTLLGAVEDQCQALLQAIKAAEGIGGFEEIDFLFGKIEGGFDQRAQFDQLLEQALISCENSPCSERTALRAAASSPRRSDR
jgi:hypothetical protein